MTPKRLLALLLAWGGGVLLANALWNPKQEQRVCLFTFAFAFTVIGLRVSLDEGNK